MALDLLVKPNLTVLVHGAYADRMAPRGTSTDPLSDADKVAFGARLKAAREAADLTQQDVAARFDVHKATVSAWEMGRGVPDALRLVKLAALYKVGVDALMGLTELTLKAHQFASQYDRLDEDKRRMFEAMWLAYFNQAAKDEPAETFTPNPEGNTDAGAFDDAPHDRRLGERRHGPPEADPDDTDWHGDLRPEVPKRRYGDNK